MNAKITPFLFFLFIFFSFFSCKNDDAETPLQEFKLSINQDGNQLYHSWTEVNISDFEQYIIVRSKEPIPVNLDPFLSSPSNSEVNEIVHQETSKETSSWKEIVLSGESNLFYRAFIKLEDRYIASNEVEVSFDKRIIYQAKYTSDIEVYHHPDLKLIYIIDVDSLFAFDYRSAELVASTELPSLFYAGLFSFGKNNGQDELYLVPQGPDDDEIIVLDAVSLNYIETFNPGYGKIDAMNTEREGIVVVFKNSSSRLQIFDRSSGDEIETVTCPCTNTYNKRIGFLSDTENLINVFFSDGIRQGGFVNFSFSDTWEFLSKSSKISFPSSVLPKIAFPSNKEYFIPNYNGTIYESDGNIFTSVYDTLSDKGTGYSYVFLEDESTLLNIDDHSLFPSSDNLRSLDKYSFPELDLVDSWKLPKNFNASGGYELFYDGDDVLLSYSSTPNGWRQVMILPLNL